MSEQSGEIENVIEHKRDHQHQIAAQRNQRQLDAVRHGYGAELGGIDLLFRHIVQGMHHNKVILGNVRARPRPLAFFSCRSEEAEVRR